MYSQQVLDHVADDVLEAFYAEEARVLRPGGIAYHQVPHRLVSYDSHTKTWFVHYLPGPLRRPLFRALGRDPDVVQELVRLRWPWEHKSRARRYF